MATFLWITVNRYLYQARITCAEIAYSQVFHFRKKLKTVGSYRSLRPNLLSTRDAPKWILHHQFLKEIENLKLQAGFEPASPPSQQYAYRYTIEVWVTSFNGICFPAIPSTFLNPRSGQTVILCNNLLFFVLVLLPTFYDGEGVLRFSEETLISLHVRNLNHKLLMWKLSARNSHSNPAAIRHTRLIVYKFLFIIGDARFLKHTFHHFVLFRRWTKNIQLPHLGVEPSSLVSERPYPVGPVQFHFLMRPTQS